MSRLSDILNQKSAYEAIGFNTVRFGPKSKTPCSQDWPNHCATNDEFAEDSNLGVILGTDFVDVDLDTSEAAKIAKHVFPDTALITGRSGNPRSHLFYRRVGPLTHRQFRTVKHGVLLELRTGKHATMMPPSIHPSGEQVEFVTNGAPAPAEALLLEHCARAVALGAVVAREIWAPGHHHDASLAMAGILAKSGVPKDIAISLTRGMAAIGGDFKPLKKNVDSTYARRAAGKPVNGFNALNAAGLDENSIVAVKSWFSYEEASVAIEIPDYEDALTTFGEFKQRNIPARDWAVNGLFYADDVCLIYGLPGHGKTLVNLKLADCLARGASFGPLAVPERRRVLYVDGEMGAADLQDTARKMNLSGDVGLMPSCDLASLRSPDITSVAEQKVIESIVENFDVVIFDNLYALTDIKEFNSQDDAGIVRLGRFVVRLRNMAKLVIVVHHGTKGGTGPAGATRLSAPVDLQINITRNGEVIKLNVEKHRGRKAPATLAFKISSDDQALALVDFSPLDAQFAEQEIDDQVLRALDNGKSGMEPIAKELGLTRSYVGGAFHRLQAKGYAAKSGKANNAPFKITPAGRDYLKGKTAVNFVAQL